MNDLDPTGLRANSPGLTDQARRDEFLRGVAAGFRVAFVWAGRNLPMALVLAAAVAVLLSATAFDWFMSSQGWLDILPGLGVFAYLGAAASVGFWYIGCWRLRHEVNEQLKIPKANPSRRNWTEAGMWGVIAVVAYVVCVGGVIVATITNTSQAKLAAEDSRRELAQLVTQRDTLAETLDIYSADYWAERLKADERKAKGQLNIARATLGMQDLDVDGGCALKLNFDQRRACALWNGGLDPHTGQEVVGVLSEIARSQANLEKATADTETLEALNTQIAGFTVQEGDKTARALGMWFSSETAGNQALLFIIVLFSAGFLLCGGLFGEWVVRQLVRKV